MAWAGCNTGFGLGLGGIEILLIPVGMWMVSPIGAIAYVSFFAMWPILIYLEDYMSTYKGGFENPTEEEILKIQSEYVVGE